MDKKGILNPTSLIFQHYFLEISINGVINRDELSKKFILDVEYGMKDNTFVVSQNGNVIKKAEPIFQKASKVQYTPIGFTDLTFPKNTSSNIISRPPNIIPIGCWCFVCDQVGPHPHKEECSVPLQKSLKLTLGGLIRSYIYGKIVQLDDEDDEEDLDDEQIFIKNYFNKVSELNDIGTKSKAAYVQAALEPAFDEFIIIKSKAKDILQLSDIQTTIDFSSVTNKKTTGNFFAGGLMVRYCNENKKRVSIRIYDYKIVVISYPYSNQTVNIQHNIINQIKKSGFDITPTSYKVNNFHGEFRLCPVEKEYDIDINQIYDYFNPTENGQPIQKEPRKFIETMGTNGKPEKNSYIVLKNDVMYKYKISNPQRGKMTISFLKCNKIGNNIVDEHICITTQIYTSSIVQLIFKYEDGKTLVIDTGCDEQIKLIKPYLQEVRDLLVMFISKLYKTSENLFVEREKKKESNKLYNTVDGVMPNAKFAKLAPGFVVETYDWDNDEWSGKIGIVYEITTKKGIRKHSVLFEEPVKRYIKEVLEWDTNDSLALVALDDEDETQAYLLDSSAYKKNDDIEHDVILYTNDNEVFNHEDIRSLKKSIYGRDIVGSQICPNKSNLTAKRPYPYSFYGVCSDKSQIVDMAGIRAKKNNKLYPRCMAMKDEEYHKQKFKSIILNGLTEEDRKAYGIRSGFVHDEPMDDIDNAILKVGSTDVGKEVKFWSEDSQEWKEGRIVRKAKNNGAGTDNLYTFYEIEVETEGEPEKYTDIKGEDFHPMYRESRNFKGINNLFKDPQDRKDFLIRCAEKLNLVKPSIELDKANEKNKEAVLGILQKLTGFSTFDEVSHKTLSFFGQNVENLTKVAHLACFVPENSNKCLALIMKDKQYLIDSENNVMQVVIDFDDTEDGTILYGYANTDVINDKTTTVFYPVDILYKNFQKVTEDYLYTIEDNSIGNQGRYFELKDICSKITNNSKIPKSIYVASINSKKKHSVEIGPIDSKISLLQYVSEKLKTFKTSDILFVPQTSALYLYWTNKTENKPFTVQLMKKDNDNKWHIGFIREEGSKLKGSYLSKKYKSLDIKSTNKDKKSPSALDYISISINLGTNGEIDSNRPFIVNGFVTKDEAYPNEKSQELYASVASRVDRKILMNPELWIFEVKEDEYVSYSGDSSSRLPLIVLNDE